MNGSVLSAEDISIGYSFSRHRRLVVAENLDLNLNIGELVCLVGPNGVGKSTLLRSLAGLQPLLQGEVALLGKSLQKIQARELAQAISVVLTERVNVGAMSAYAVVALGRHPYTNWLGSLTEQDERVVNESLRAVGAEDLSQRYFNELSDGERQKIMIARALAQEPLILLLDEPTAFLDLPRRVVLMQMLRDLAHQLKKAILVSTHDLDLVLHSADIIWLMSTNSGMTMGAPEDLVLNGEFERVFAQQGVRFDSHSGNFIFSPHSKKSVGLIGKGLTKLWTSKALKRAGFHVLKNNQLQENYVEVLNKGEKTFWRYHHDGEYEDFATIYALIASINN